MKRILRKAFWAIALAGSVMLVTLAASLGVDSALGDIDSPRIDERVRTAEAVGNGIAAWFESGKSEAEAIAKSLEPWTGSPSQSGAARSTLDRGVSTTSVFDDGAFVLEPRGRVVATTTGKAQLIQLDRSSGHSLSALRGTTVVSGVIEDPLERIPVVAFAAPLRDQAGKVSGALIATSRVDGAVSRLIKHFAAESKLAVSSGTQVLIVAPDGTALAPDTTALIQRDLADAQVPAQQARADSDPGFLEFVGEGGVAKIAGYAKASDDWAVVLPQDASDFFSFGTGFIGHLTRATPTRAAALMIALFLAGGAVAIILLRRRLRRAEARAEEAKRAFLAITGHELRTPLTSIRGFSQMLSSRWDGIPDDDRKELIQTISRQARNLEHLVERLILGGQLEAGMGPAPVLRTIDAADAMDVAVDQYGSMSKLHSIEVEFARPLMVEADAKMLQEVFGHLLENALKYSPAGGSVWVKGRRNGGRVQITVEDEGVGLPSDISGIFEKFVQGEAVDTRTHDEGGVGLGLFIVKTLLNRMHASVDAERRDGAGARFVVTLKAGKQAH